MSAPRAAALVLPVLLLAALVLLPSPGAAGRFATPVSGTPSASPVASPGAVGAGIGTIDGQVVGKNGATKIGGTPVVLEIGTGAATPDERTATAGDDGRFRFENVPLASGNIYLLKVTFEGGNYFRDVTFNQGVTAANAGTIEVYPATRSDADVAFPRLRMLVTQVDASGLQFVETGAYSNTGKSAYIGPGGGSGAQTLRFNLPTGAVGVTIAQGLNRDTLVQAPDGFATVEAIPPGEQSFAYTYGIAIAGATFTLERVFPYNTGLFQLYVPPGVRVNSDGGLLKDSGVSTLPNGQQYRIYTAQSLAAGTRLTARLSNLPSGSGAVNPLLPAMAVFVLLLGIGLIVAYGRRRKPATALAMPRGKARTVPANPPAPVAPAVAGASVEELTERRRRLLLDLVELDERFEAGELPEAAYRRERSARKSELVAVLAELEAGAARREA